jgi:hypothetical protein
VLTDLSPRAVINDMTNLKGFIIRSRLQKRLVLPILLILKSLSIFVDLFNSVLCYSCSAYGIDSGLAMTIRLNSDHVLNCFIP